MFRVLGMAALALVALAVGVGVFLANNIYLRDGHVAVPDAELDTDIAASDLRADLDTLLQVFEETHVDFRAINGPAYARAVVALGDRLEEPMTRVEFYNLLAPLNALLSDGHTSVLLPAEELDLYEREGGLYLPLLVEIENAGIRISRPVRAASPFRRGDRLVAVNGVPAEELARDALAAQSGENLALRQAYAARSFYRMLAIRGLHSPFDIEVDRAGQRIRDRVEGVTRPVYVSQRDQARDNGNSLAFVDDDIAVLTFSDMPSQLRSFRRFLDASFDEIAARGADTLIIDIRNNGGGDSRAGDLLHQYVADQDYPAIGRVDVRVTERIQAYYRTLLPRGFRWIPLHRFVAVLRLIETSEPGSVFALHPDGEAPREWASLRDNAFQGRLIVLTGPATYSSAAIFAAPLHHFDRAIFIGEETGEPAVFFGENYVFDLPNSRLQAVVSHKRFDLVGDGDHRTGLQPDIPVEAADALDAAIAHARDQRQSNTAP